MVPEPRRAWVTWALLGAAVGCFLAAMVMVWLHALELIAVVLVNREQRSDLDWDIADLADTLADLEDRDWLHVPVSEPIPTVTHHP